MWKILAIALNVLFLTYSTGQDNSTNNSSTVIEAADFSDKRRFATNFEDLYQEGISKYLDEDWHGCVAFMKHALEDYHWHTDTLTSCRRGCKKESEEGSYLGEDLTATETFYENVVKNALCLLKCRRDKFGPRKSFTSSAEVAMDFEMKKPYDYLQLCYFKTGFYEDAANAAVTVLATQPDHEVMANNLKQYIEKYNVKPDDLLNLEMKPFAEEYVAGDRFHMNEDYEMSVKHMEAALEVYWDALEDCKALCEEPFDMGWFPDFVSSVANHFAFTFRCKRKCVGKLSNLYGEEIPNFLASIFNYLQFGYYKLGDVELTAQAVESYLQLNPGDPEIVRNKELYIEENPESAKYFVARPEIVKHAESERYEKSLLEFIDTEFVFIEEEEKLAAALAKDFKGKTDVTATSPVKEARNKMNEDVRSILNRGERSKTVITLKEEELNGTNRYVADGLISPIKCEILKMLTQVAGQNGDGYLLSVNPHTKYEDFKGLTLGRAGLMVYAGLIGKDVLQLLVNVSEEAKSHVAHYFNVEDESLYFSYTHLVCRSTREDTLDPRPSSDMSHTVHVDNCIFLGKDHPCLRIPPAYTFRHYSAVLYFNEVGEGGEFVFSDDITGQVSQSSISPKCGRLIGFSAGPENPHGVKPVLSGDRCAMALWFTLDPKHKEKERTLAEKYLQQLGNGKGA